MYRFLVVSCILTFFFMSSVQAVAPNNYCKFLKIECKSSGMTCTNYTCKLKPVSRENSLMSATFPFNRTLRKFSVNITAWHKEKIARNYRQVFNLEKIDYCSTKKNINMIPWFKDLMYFADHTFPGLVQDCPIKGPIVITNASLARTDEEDKIMANVGMGNVPNGLIKTRIGVYDDTDPNIITAVYINECNKHEQAYNGNAF